MPILPAGSVSAAKGAVIPIAQAISNGAVSAFTFTNIPQTYQDLKIVFAGRSNFDAIFPGLSIYINNHISNSGYSITYLTGDGSNSTSGQSNSGWGINTSIPGSYTTTGVFESFTCDIFDYTNTTKYKNLIFKGACDRVGAGYTTLITGTYKQNTNAITQLSVEIQGVYASGSFATLYGIRSINQ